MSYQDIVATIGVYERDGKKQYVTRKVGVMMQTDKGPRIKLDASFNPAGCMRSDDGGVWLALFYPKPRDHQQAPQQKQQPRTTSRPEPTAPQFDDFDQDIPF